MNKTRLIYGIAVVIVWIAVFAFVSTGHTLQMPESFFVSTLICLFTVGFILLNVLDEMFKV